MNKQRQENEHSAKVDKLAYRIDEACQALGIGRTSLYNLVKVGQLELIRISGRSLVPAYELYRLTQSSPTKSLMTKR